LRKDQTNQTLVWQLNTHQISKHIYLVHEESMRNAHNILVG